MSHDEKMHFLHYLGHCSDYRHPQTPNYVDQCEMARMQCCMQD